MRQQCGGEIQTTEISNFLESYFCLRTNTGCPKKILIEKIISKIECCGAKFSHRNDLVVLDPALSVIESVHRDSSSIPFFETPCIIDEQE